MKYFKPLDSSPSKALLKAPLSEIVKLFCGFFASFCYFFTNSGGIMLKLCAFILLLPLGTFAKISFDPYPTTEPVLKIKANNPQLKGLEVELSNGDTVSLREFLEEIAENREELAEYGGEVPWPDNDDGKKGKRKDKY